MKLLKSNSKQRIPYNSSIIYLISPARTSTRARKTVEDRSKIIRTIKQQGELVFPSFVTVVSSLLAFVFALRGGGGGAAGALGLFQELIQTERIFLVLLELHWP